MPPPPSFPSLRSLLLSAAVLAAAALVAPAAAQQSVRDVLLAAPDCAQFSAALQKYRPDVFTAIAQPSFEGSVLCPNALAMSRRPLPADPAAAAAVISYHVVTSPLPSSPNDGEEFVTLLPNARVYASRRGGGPLVHLVGGDAPSSLAPLPVDNTATRLASESPRGGGKGVVALIDIVLQPPASAMPPPSAATAAPLLSAPSSSSAATATAALEQARILTATTMTPTPDHSTTADVRVDATGGPSFKKIDLVPKKIAKALAKFVSAVLP